MEGIEALFLATLVGETAVVIAALWIVVAREVRRVRNDAAIHALLHTFGHAVVAAQDDPKQVLVWHPLAEASRQLFPEAFAAVEGATGGRFPFPKEVIERAHARVSAAWLAWEQAHDEEYRIKAAAAEQEMTRASGEDARLARARLDRIQHEKIERYQQRYEEYVRTAKALQALLQ